VGRAVERAAKPPSRKGPLAALRLGGSLLLALALGGCERGCARSWFEQHGVSEQGIAPPGAPMINAIDCTDGLARCVEGVVEVSRVATIPQPCNGKSGPCECPWERAGDCDLGCVADGATLVVDREKALAQLCAARPDAGPRVRPALQAAECDEDVLYRCAGGAVVSCEQHSVVALCERGCATEGGDIGIDVHVDRVGAFAILCSR
jgi:hypothetical protein